MTDQLSIYRMTAQHLRVRRFASLNDNVEARRVLDDFWSNVVERCLEEAQWNFMLRAIEIDASGTLTPAFGRKYAFQKPNDWLRTTIVAADETFTPPLTDYDDEGPYWYADFTPLYIKYQSSDPQYGMDLGAWSGNFTAYVALQLAEDTCGKITGNAELLEGPNGISARLKRTRIKAKSNDAMNMGPKEMPTGTWARSRRGFLRGVPLPGGTSYDD